jgi:FkbM family methyltransferase
LEIRVASGSSRHWRLWPKRRKTQPAEAILFRMQDLADGRRSRNEARIRSLCAAVYLGQGTALCRVLGRYKMFVDTTDIGVSSHLMLDGYWEMWLTEAMARVVRPGMTVVDIGANLGYFTLLLADFVGPSGQVHAFEPNPPITERLRRTVSINGFMDRVAVHETALSDRNGAEVLLVVPASEPKNAYIIPADRRAGPQERLLRTRRLDSFAEIPHADIVKIDADVAEEGIWRGMAGLLEKPRPMTIFLEFAAARYPDPARFLADIQAHGFSLARLDLEQGVKPLGVADILAAPPKRDQMLVLCR